MKEFESFSVEALLGGNAGNAVLKKVIKSSMKEFESLSAESLQVSNAGNAGLRKSSK